MATHSLQLYSQLMKAVRQVRDPRTKDWFLVYDTPVYVWGLSILYLLIVWLGPKAMKHRPAYDLRGFMMAYNAFLVALSAYMVGEIWYSAYLNSYNPICQPYNADTWKRPGELRMAKVLWWYFFSKLIEFMDTFLMILRKKTEQVTFLHVFHHVSMFNIWWFSMTLIPGGQSWFSSSVNSLIHVFMYSYYLLNQFPSMRRHLWWKRYITQLQLVQFVVILFHTANTHWSGCDFPIWGTIMLVTYMFIMLTLFGNFYIQAYIKGRRRQPTEKSKYRSGDHLRESIDINQNHKND